MSAPSTEVLFARCHDECVRLQAQIETLEIDNHDLRGQVERLADILSDHTCDDEMCRCQCNSFPPESGSTLQRYDGSSDG